MNKTYTNIEEQIESICKNIKEKTEDKITILASDVLGLGLDLLKTAASLEVIAKEAGYTLWWRYTNGIEGDITKQKPKSFGRTLLAGFINDGAMHFRDGMLGFDTACTYVYWANTHYFKHHLFRDQLKFANDLEVYIQENGYSVNAEALTSIKEFSTNQIENTEFNIDYDKVEKFFSEINPKINRIIINIQRDSQYKPEIQESTIIDFHNRKTRLLVIDSSRIKDAFSGSLVAFPLKLVEEQDFLADTHNRDVVDLDSSVLGRGEGFHPRLSSHQLEQIKSRLLPVYSNGQLVSLQQLKEELSSQIL